jgi:hypothetical protein
VRRPGPLLLLLAAAAAPAFAAPAPTSCVTCHANPALFAGEAARIVGHFRDDVHAKVGLSCQDCHGGNPDPALSDDLAAMDEGFAPNPFRGAPERAAIPGFCGRCHSDPVTMKRFRPDLRVDQEKEYWTSHHGQRLARGDTKVATCIDCHGVHGILRVGDARSPVHPKRVAETCRSCHGHAKHMAGYTRDDGRPLPTDQYAHWRQSVHAKALLERDDLSAPTCNDCHGNHGAAPPGVGSVAFVCGQCHGREAELFRASPKQQGFAAHNELLAGAGPEGCAACHEAPEPQAAIRSAHPLTECTVCHGNHAIVRPTVAMLSPRPVAAGTPARAAVVRCADCHAASPVLASEPVGLRTAQTFLTRMRELSGLTARAERILLAARRGGVETRHALQEVDAAGDAQIELAVLVHGFSADPKGAFAQKHREGIAHARAAVDAGQRALDELAYRRRGLAVSLVLIVLVLIGLALKIRQLPPAEPPAG